MKRVLLLMATYLTLMGCSQRGVERPQYMMDGAWVLRQAVHPDGSVVTYDTASTICRIYGGDSVFYQCRLARTISGIVIVPEQMCNVTVVDRGNGSRLYIEDNDPHPLVVETDSTISIQSFGTRFVWQRAEDITRDWGAEMRRIITNDLAQNDDAEKAHIYELSTIVRMQATAINWLSYILATACVVIFIVVHLFIYTNRRRKSLQWLLQQINEEHEQRPQLVKIAIQDVEDVFFASEEYDTLHRRISKGERLSDEDWKEIEGQLKRVYPGFTSRLRNLYQMSELEYQVCLLIKLRITPTEMADVLSRDGSTISTVRSRLFMKVFGRKGGARDWDDFIFSIGS